MSTDSGGTSSRPPNRFWDQNREQKETLGRTALQKAVLFLIVAIIVTAAVTYKFGWFPFDNRGQLQEVIRETAASTSNLPVERVELTGEGEAIAVLSTGERLAVRWIRTGEGITCLIQRPLAETQATFTKKLKAQAAEVKSMDLRPSSTGVGYVGEIELATGEVLDVIETTDLKEMACYQEFRQSKKTYPNFARKLLEQTLGIPVLEILDAQPGDFSPKPAPGTDRLYLARMRTAAGKYAVELYREVPAEGIDANQVWSSVKIAYRALKS